MEVGRGSSQQCNNILQQNSGNTLKAGAKQLKLLTSLPVTSKFHLSFPKTWLEPNFLNFTIWQDQEL